VPLLRGSYNYCSFIVLTLCIHDGISLVFLFSLSWDVPGYTFDILVVFFFFLFTRYIYMNGSY
jgi:hypothetical protein